MTTSIHETNRQCWDNLSSHWKELRDRDNLWQRIPHEPDLAFEGGALDVIQTFCDNLEGKDVCVIGSGDNYAAFALAGLGANVTSTDISQRQLDVAQERAQHLGLDMDFVRADAADLAPLPDNTFDLVCSTNGFFVWISQPARVFEAVQRVLKPGGCLHLLRHPSLPTPVARSGNATSDAEVVLGRRPLRRRRLL